ncbi:TRAP transporter substrate-binding protein [Desulfosediminicola flagellatus]|uniref:TRAP transporter substrate-binding protein n=1 Tax=Desulfosediminicola flagellatus TaxID=2569541 RepID=UPI0010ABCD79|nr:TRAP transporter substrate-binding protein [Desulfosediminicola flagellatus]
MKNVRKLFLWFSNVLTICLVTAHLSFAADPLAKWQPEFDPTGAKYTYLLSCVGHPAIEGVAVGFRIRDRVWEETNGQLYVDFRPLSQLGGEKDVINKLKFGAVQGMMSSSVAAANISPKLGIVNLPFVVDSFDKLDAFRNTAATWEPFRDAALSKGLQAIDFTGYGSYGWATTTPVTSLAEAAGVNFRIAQAPVNIDAYKAWDLKFSVLPWPDVPQALQTGVINGLDHTPIVCNISKKFTVARYYTELDYAQGLYVHMINTKWLKSLPEDVRETLLRVIAEESAAARQLTKDQQEREIAAAKKDGVVFLKLTDADLQKMKSGAETVYTAWQEKIGKQYLQTVRTSLN